MIFEIKLYAKRFYLVFMFLNQLICNNPFFNQSNILRLYVLEQV